MFKRLNSTLNNYSTWSYYLTNHIRGHLPKSDSHARLVYLQMHMLFERTDLKNKHNDIYLKLNDVAKDCNNYIYNKGIYAYETNYNRKDIIKQIDEKRQDIKIIDEKLFNEVAPLPFKIACSLNEKYLYCKNWLGIKHNKNHDWGNTFLYSFMSKTFPP